MVILPLIQIVTKAQVPVPTEGFIFAQPKRDQIRPVAPEVVEKVAGCFRVVKGLRVVS